MGDEGGSRSRSGFEEEVFLSNSCRVSVDLAFRDMFAELWEMGGLVNGIREGIEGMEECCSGCGIGMSILIPRRWWEGGNSSLVTPMRR